MPSKIEVSLNQEELIEFFKRCAQLRGAKLRDIQALAEEFGIDVSLMAARSFKQGAFSEYLDELKAKREMAESVALVVRDGLDLTAAAAANLAAKVFDRSLNLDASEIGTEEGNMVSLAVARLQAGSRGDKDLARKLADSETKRAAIEQRMEMQQFDAAQAAIEHAKEIRSVMADSGLDGAAKTERVRQILFGQKPADFKPVTDKGAQSE